MKHFQQQQFIRLPFTFSKSVASYTRWLLTLFVCLLAFPGIARIWYIAPANSGNGSATSWNNASNNLVNALDNAVSGDEVWVKAGTYRRYDDHAFQLKNGVKLYGGFAGGENGPGNRSTNVTDYQVTITNSPTQSGTNSTNYDFPVLDIVNSGASSTLDRITFSGAFTSDNHGAFGIGGAIYMSNSSPVINNVMFNNCAAEFEGGAIYMTNSSPTFTSCSFTNNESKYNRGGAIFATNNCKPIFTNVSFSGNYSPVSGGAILMQTGRITSTNVTFINNRTVTDGGAVSILNTTEISTFTNAVFEQNKSGYSNSGGFSSTGNGGGLHVLKSSYTATNCVFFDNRSGGNGGAIYQQEGIADNLVAPKITNVLFYKNGTYSSSAGAIANDRTSPVITNCTFSDNYCGVSTGAGGVYSYAPTTSVTDRPAPTVVNSLFYKNGFATLSSNGVTDIKDIGQLRATTAVTYSCFKEAADFSGFNTNNIPLTDITAPFINYGSAKGPDGRWMTADDGFRPSFCATTMIDRGNNAATSVSTDLAGQARKKDVPLVANTGSGTAPIVDIGAYENQDAATAASLAGTIGNQHAIPNPQELRPDYITNVQSPVGGTNITWQKKVGTNNTNNWETADSITNTLQYALPTLTTTTTFRRMVVAPAYCNLEVYSNEVVINVVSPDGTISGQVRSLSGTGIPGITITATRKGAQSGSAAGKTYTTVTGNNGGYTIDPVYYGDPSDQSYFARDSFKVVPSKEGHIFNLDFIGIELTENSRTKSGVDFTDKTVLTITGSTYQQCSGCVINNQTCPIDSVMIYKDGSYNTISGNIDSVYGRYAVAVSDPSQTVIRPRLTGHRFVPDSVILTPTNNITGIDFKDTTTHTIKGKFTAGCSEYIGNAVLEFTDVLPKGPGGASRPGCFVKRVATTGSGEYTVRLPARKYRVSLYSYTPAGSNLVVADTVIKFVNYLIPPDSLTRDISTRDTTLNIAYVRAPQVSISGGLNIVCMNANGTPFALLKQAATDSFKVTVFQGPATLGCPLADSVNTIRILTNVQREDQLDSMRLPVKDSGTIVRLTGGIPNIIGPPQSDYLKNVFMYFTDRYGRITPPFNRKVLVTGIKSDPSTFTTVSPQVPLVVLHDPPGDASYSQWQSTQSITNAVRMYTNVGGSVEAWAEAKLGTKFIVGGLGLATEVAVWGTTRAGIGVSASNTSSGEAIVTATTQNTFSTSDQASSTNSSGDVYIGAALNLVYAVATDITFNPATCTVASKRRLAIANDGFATEYIYNEDYIVNYLIPGLQSIAMLSPDSAAKYNNQVNVWQQVIANNAENKRRATFVENKSFSGGGSSVSNTVTTSSSKSSSIEFTVGLDASVALELGLEAAGAGVSGGVSVNMRMETGKSETTTTTNETSISYTLKDNTDGDAFTVNVKKDPVYNTPVFELVAGKSSCPPEPGTQPRDAVFFTTDNPVVQNVAPTAPANFVLKITNTSAATADNPQTDKRTYKLNYVQSSNVANETITIAGSTNTYVTSPLGYLETATIPISITRQNGSSVYSYENEVFSVSSNCDDDLGKTVAVSAYFTSPCSSINLAQPADNWVVTAASNNQLFVKADGYNTTGLNSVELQYATNNSNTWMSAQTLTSTDLANGLTFNVAALPEGAASVRLRLNCNSGTVYSQRANGFIDRKAPQLFGRPTPTDDIYTNGETISFTYNEKLTTDAGSLQITMRRLSNNTLIPATASIFENKIIIVPNSSITSFSGDSIRVIINGIKDVYGNVRMMADTTGFVVGTSTPATGNQALTVSINNPMVYKNDTAAIRVVFSLPANAATDTRVNYTISGTARYNIDYTATYTGADALYANFNGSTGSIRIPAGARTATLTLRPKGGDTSYTPNKTIIISATEGGDYGLGATTSVTGNLTSEDGIMVYTFIGDGNWNIKNNWQNGNMPLTTLVAPKEIVVNPSGTARLNVAQTIKPGAKITVKQNRQFVIQGSLKQQ